MYMTLKKRIRELQDRQDRLTKSNRTKKYLDLVYFNGNLNR